MEHVNTKLRENRKNSIKLQQKIKKSPLSIYEEKVEEYIEKYINAYDVLGPIMENTSEENDDIVDVEIDMDSLDDLLNNKKSREENIDLIKQLNFFETLYTDFDNVSENDEFVKQEIKCIVENKNNPNIVTIGEERVVLIDVYKELEKELERQKQLKLNRGLYIF